MDEVEGEAMDCDDSIPASLGMALILNKAYQEVINEAINHVDVAIAQTREQREELLRSAEDVSTAKPRCKRKSMFLLTYPYFKDESDMPAPKNDDCKLRELQQFSRKEPARTWRDVEEAELRRAVHTDALRNKMAPLMSRLEVDCAKLAQVKADLAIITKDFFKRRQLQDQHSALEANIKKTDDELERIRQTFTLDCVTAESQVDWMRISVNQFEGLHSAESCAAAWRNVVRPAFNRGKWTSDEDRRLSDLVRKHKSTNWAVIATELDTGRSPIACIQRYQRVLHKDRHGLWDAEQDEKLIEVVQSEIATRGMIPWFIVAKRIGRPPIHCQYRWVARRMEFASGAWTVEEDAMLVEAVSMYGIADPGMPMSFCGAARPSVELWSRVSGHVKTRSAAQCRSRWFSTLDPQLKFGKWTRQEDEVIRKWIAKHGRCKWSALAALLPGRSANMVVQRARRPHLRKVARSTSAEQDDQQDGSGGRPLEVTEAVFSRKTKVARSAIYDQRQELVASLLLGRVASSMAHDVPHMDKSHLNSLLMRRVQRLLSSLPVQMSTKFLKSNRTVAGCSDLKAAIASYVSHIGLSLNSRGGIKGARPGRPPVGRPRRRHINSSGSDNDECDQSAAASSTGKANPPATARAAAAAATRAATAAAIAAASATSAAAAVPTACVAPATAAATTAIVALAGPSSSKRKRLLSSHAESQKKRRLEQASEKQGVDARITELTLAIAKAGLTRALPTAADPSTADESTAATLVFLQMLGLNYVAALARLRAVMADSRKLTTFPTTLAYRLLDSGSCMERHLSTALCGGVLLPQQPSLQPQLLPAAAAVAAAATARAASSRPVPLGRSTVSVLKKPARVAPTSVKHQLAVLRAQQGAARSAAVSSAAAVLPQGSVVLSALATTGSARVVGPPLMTAPLMTASLVTARNQAGHILMLNTAQPRVCFSPPAGARVCQSPSGPATAASTVAQACAATAVRAGPAAATAVGRAATAASVGGAAATAAAAALAAMRAGPAPGGTPSPGRAIAPRLVAASTATADGNSNSLLRSSPVPLVVRLDPCDVAASRPQSAGAAAVVSHSAPASAVAAACGPVQAGAAPSMAPPTQVAACTAVVPTVTTDTALPAAAVAAAASAPASGNGSAAATAGAGVPEQAPASVAQPTARLPLLPPQVATVGGYGSLLSNRPLLEASRNVLTKIKLEHLEKCLEKERSRPAFLALKARIESLFLWPAILSRLSPEQDPNLQPQQP